MNREPTMVDVALDAARRIGAASRDDEIAKLKAENKRLHGHVDLLRGHSIPSEIDFSQLVAQEDEIKLLMARCAELEAELSTWIQAVGIASTLKPDMEINVSDPIGMMQKVVEYVEGKSRSKGV